MANIIASTRVSELRPDLIQPGSVKRRCLACRADCWISPSSQRVMDAEPDAIVLCIACTNARMKAMRAREHSLEFKVAPGAMEEFEAMFGEAGVDFVKTHLMEMNEGREQL